MRSISRSLKAFIFVFLLCSNLFAQLPDPYVHDFSPKFDVITAKTAREHQIRSLNIYKNGKIFNTIIFDSEGELVRHGKENTFILYNEKGWKREAHHFEDNKYIGQVTYELTPYGDPKITNETYATNLGKINKKTTYTYAKGLISDIAINTSNEMIYVVQYSNTNYKYTYDKKRRIKKVIVSTGHSTYSALGNSSDLASLDSLVYENGRLAFFTDDSVMFKYYYNDKGQVSHLNEVNPDTNSWVKELTINRYTYYDNGLIKSYEEGALHTTMWTYEYDFMDPATFMVEIPDAYNEVSFWNYSTSSDKQTHKIKNNHVIAKINIPDLELYVAQLSPQLTIPLILQPGKKVFVSTANGGIGFAPADTMNTYALQLERARHEAYQVYGADKAPGVLANYLVNEIKKHPTHPAFLYYVDTWDTGNHKQLFLNYTEKMNALYPNNYKVNEIYTLLRKSN